MKARSDERYAPGASVMEEATSLEDLYQHYAATIALMPRDFTSHEFILSLAQKHQREYVAALAARCGRGEPFREVHQLLSTKLGGFPDLLERRGTAKSHDIFGNANTCSSWRKLR
jgi:hypothetical protein